MTDRTLLLLALALLLAGAVGFAAAAVTLAGRPVVVEREEPVDPTSDLARLLLTPLHEEP